jgi:hypothetical protein
MKFLEKLDVKKFDLKKFLFWAGLIIAVIGLVLGIDDHSVLTGISNGIAALAFLKASEMLPPKN